MKISEIHRVLTLSEVESLTTRQLCDLTPEQVLKDIRRKNDPVPPSIIEKLQTLSDAVASSSLPDNVKQEMLKGRSLPHISDVIIWIARISGMISDFTGTGVVSTLSKVLRSIIEELSDL